MKHDRVYLLKYFRYIKPYKWSFIAGFTCIPLIAVCHLMQPLLLKHGIDNNILTQDLPALYITAIIYACVITLEFILRALQGFLFQRVGQYTLTDIRRDLFSHILTLSMGFFDKTPQGQITSKLTSDIESLNDSFTSGVVTILSDILTLLGILIAMLYLSPKLTFITLISVPPLSLLVYICQRRIRYYFTRIRRTIGELSGMLQEQLAGIAIIQIFQREKHNYLEFRNLNNIYKKSTLGAVYYDAFLYSLMESMSSIVIALMIWYGWSDPAKSSLSLGLLVAFIDYIHKFFQPLKELSNKFAILQHALAALEKIFGTFDIQDRVSEGNDDAIALGQELVFNSVSFAYKGYESKPILTDISFHIRPGDLVALVGPTGSGKTTISQLIYRLYEGYSGSILLGNKDIRDLSLAALRKNIATVTQDNQLFNASVAFNIALGNPAITLEKVIEAAKYVHVHDFIMALPDGYDTVLENKEGGVSNGQAQLIALARALASDAPLVLLDEATASIDSLSEKLIQKALDVLFKKKTVLVIAHRLSTIQHASTILALKEGRVIESGTHDDLLAQGGFYSKLYKMQF